MLSGFSTRAFSSGADRSRRRVLSRALGIPFLLTWVLLACGDNATETTYEPNLRVRGRVHPSLDSTLTSYRAYIEFDQRTELGNDFHSEIDQTGRFECALDPGPYRVTLGIPNQSPLYLSVMDSAAIERTDILIEAEPKLLDLDIQLYSATIHLDVPELGDDRWDLFAFEKGNVDGWSASIRSWSPSETPSRSFRHLPAGQFDLLATSPYGEKVELLISKDGTRVSSIEAGPAGHFEYRAEAPSPDIFRIVPEGPAEPEYFTVTGIRSGNGGFSEMVTVWTGPALELPIFSPAPVRIGIHMLRGIGTYVGGTTLGTATVFHPNPGGSTEIIHRYGSIQLLGDPPNDNTRISWTLFTEAGDLVGDARIRFDDAVTNIPPGSYRVALSSLSSGGPDYPFQWHDGGTSWWKSQPVEVHAGEITEVRWTPWEGGVIRGRLSRPLKDDERLRVWTVQDAASGYHPTDADVSGLEFQATGLPRDDLVLYLVRGLNSEWFFPGVSSRYDASTFRFDLADTLEVYFEL